MFKKLLSLSVIICFFLTSLCPLPKAHAETNLGLPAPGSMVNLSPAYEPVMIKGLTIHKDNPFLFDFIVDIGQDKMAGEPLKKEGEKLIKYFLASLAIPDKDVWVNLSPYEKSKMIPDALGQTDMGRDLLEQDYILKQITASLIYPEKQLGKTFWDKVYTKAQEMYGTTQIPVNTFNKVWIMADRAEVFEHNQTAFVTDQHLKVMLEEDYLALTHHAPVNTHTIASQVVKQIILPELEKEVNTGKNFANLRQIFNSIILSSWYKRNLKEALLNQVYANKSKVNGVIASGAKQSREQIYEQYLKAYKKGVFNYIKEDVNAQNGERLPRKYFSGGINPGKASVSELTVTTDSAMGAQEISRQQYYGEVDFATLASTQSMYPGAGKLPKSTRAAIRQFRRVDLSAAPSISRAKLDKESGRALKARIQQLENQPPDNAMASKATYDEIIVSSYIEAESLLNQLMYPEIHLVANFNKKDANEQARSLLRSIVRTGAARVLADYISQQGLDFEDTLVREQIEVLLSYIREKVVSKGTNEPVINLKDERGTLKEAGRFLRLAADRNNPKEREAIVLLALDRLYAIDNPPVNSLREFLKSHESLTKSWALISGLLTQADKYIRVHDSAMIVQPVTGFDISPELARAFDEKIGNFTATGRPTAGKDTLMPLMIGKINKLLPEANQIVTVSTGEYVAGIIRLVKNAYTSAQAGLKASDQEKYGAYVGLLNDEDRANMENGKLIKDETMYRVINKIFEEPWIVNAKHIFFNGFPRNMGQWNAIQDGKILLRGKPLTINFFLDINLPREATFARAEKRTEDRRKENLPPRPDDSPAKVADRQNEFDTYTRPMVEDIASGNPQEFRRISSYFPDDSYEESLRKTSDQFVRTLHDFLGLPMHYDNYQQMFEAAEQGAFETKKFFYIRTNDFPASREVMVSNIGDDWISGYEIAQGGVVKTGQGIVVIHKDQFAQASEADVAMLADSEIRNQKNAFLTLKSLDGKIILSALTSAKKSLGDSGASLSVISIYGAIERFRSNEDGKFYQEYDKINGTYTLNNIMLPGQNIPNAFWNSFAENILDNAADQAMTARDTAEIFLENINEGDFRPERYTDLPIYTGRYSIEAVSLKPGDMVLDDTDLNQVIEALSAGTQIKVSATYVYVFSGKDGRVLVLSGTGRGAERTLAVADQAALAKAPVTPGGIDLNTSSGMQWKVSRDGHGVEMNIDPALIERVRREGIESLSPVILKMTPVGSIWPLAGLEAPVQ